MKFHKMISSLILLVILVTVVNSARANEKMKKAGDTLSKIFSNYDRRFRPNYGGAPVEVGITAYVLTVPEMDTIKEEITLDFYFRQFWNDPRVANDGSDSFTLNDDSNIWSPDTFFVNELVANEHTVTAPNTFVRLSPNGDILKSVRYTLTLACPMNLRSFPFDNQICIIEIESFGFSAKDVAYKWAKGVASVGLSTDSSNGEFTVLGHRLMDHTVNLTTGVYSRLTIELLFRRNSGRYVSEFFYPCMFLVAFSFLALFVADQRVSVVLNGMAMAVTILFLAVSTGSLETFVMSSSTSLDTFSSITNTFVFLSLFISIVNVYLSKNKFDTQKFELVNLRPDRVRLESHGDEEAATFATNSNQVKPSHIPPSRIEAAALFIGGIFLKCLPVIKIVLILSYCLTIFIFWTTVPYADTTPEDFIYLVNWAQ